MDRIGTELQQLIKVGTIHEPELPRYAQPRIVEWFKNTKHIADSIFSSPERRISRLTLKHSVEFVERHNGMLAQWAKLEAAGVEMVSLLASAREVALYPALAKVTMPELQQAMECGADSFRERVNESTASR